MISSVNIRKIFPKGYRRARIGEKLTANWGYIKMPDDSPFVRLPDYHLDFVGARISSSWDDIYIIKKNES